MANSTVGGMDESELVLLGIVAAIGFIWWKGGFAGAAAAAGEAAANAVVDATKGAVTGAVGAIGAQVGLPTPATLTDDPYVSRWIMDHSNGGQFAASKWSTSSAYLNGLTLDRGTGFPPEIGTPLYAQFPGVYTGPAQSPPFDGGDVWEDTPGGGGVTGHW